MNAINIKSGLVCLLVAGLATSTASAIDAAAAEAHRAEKEQRQEQRQERRQEQRQEQQQHQAAPRGNGTLAGNPAPQRQGPPSQAASGGSRPPGYNANNHPPGQNAGNNGGNTVIGPPRGNDNRPGNAHIVPPRYANQPGNGYPPGNYHPPGNNRPPGNNHSPGYGRPPRYLPSLPSGYRQHYWNGNPYYYGGGHWYRPYGNSYVVVGAPYGLFVSTLPYYSSFWFGSTRYYYADGVYYNYEPARSGYVVAPSPYEDERKDEVATIEDMYIYPAQGQSQQQQADDKYECHRWAVDQTGYDPTSSDFDEQRRADYTRAMTACLTGRGYTVR